MKSRVIFVLALLLVLFILLTRSNHSIQDTILNVITPIKQNYKNLTRSVKDRGKSYIFQKENIQRLTKENKVLRKYLLDQTHYLQQVSALYKKIPSLEKLPHRSMELVNTISYIRLNSFNEVMLTRPQKALLDQEHLYGLIQNDVVGGTAILRGENLYGYLTSNARCRFGVFIGESRSSGIAEGRDKDTMVIKFIPKWAKVDVGDKVETSGLDGIFFANVPVGVVKKVKIENSYKTAYIKTYNDTRHPDYFFLITDTTPYLTSAYDKESTNLEENISQMTPAPASGMANTTISSIPEAVQTQDTVVDPTEFEIPKEKEATPPPKPPVVLRHPKVTKPKKKPAESKPPLSPADASAESEKPQTQMQKPKPRKRPSPMDIINGRGF
jgi:rod shape-determining protein MreC